MCYGAHLTSRITPRDARRAVTLTTSTRPMEKRAPPAQAATREAPLSPRPHGWPRIRAVRVTRWTDVVVLEACSRHLGASWGSLGGPGRLLGVLGASGGLLGPLGVLLGGSWGPLGGLLGASWGHLGAILGPSWGLLGPPGRLLGPSWKRSITEGGVAISAAPREPRNSPLGAFLGDLKRSYSEMAPCSKT